MAFNMAGMLLHIFTWYHYWFSGYSIWTPVKSDVFDLSDDINLCIVKGLAKMREDGCGGASDVSFKILHHQKMSMWLVKETIGKHPYSGKLSHAG
jgi:hypothetical protein